MTSLIGFLTLISALTSTSSALSCTECTSTSTTCSGFSRDCPPGTLCGSTYTKVLTGVLGTELLVRGCIPLSECNFNGTMSMKEVHTGVGISCCSIDKCTPPFPTFPTKSPNPNGVICPSCISDKSTRCYTSDTIQCTGDEKMCVLQKTEITGLASAAMRGCATKSYCDLGSQSYNTGGSSIKKVTYTCTSGGISAHKVILTPAIVCLLLLKLFL
ncbi:phospholipase A2 inhibitor and Ly6/PLAUR domain-containing protein-like [Eleutherodactylus coqui]|uniref:phospholipase A2 inhibitor and Ly6/PLAUR domain-containing protein-like n=1 Tax=Eleutherodactylus coqui TaxID=57060 RepID=UPI003463533E